MKEKGSIIASEIISDYRREMEYKQRAERLKQFKKTKKPNHLTLDK